MNNIETIGLSFSPMAGYISTFFAETPSPWITMPLTVFLSWCFLFTIPILLIAFFERKIAADIQMRIGPNRVGPSGFFQGIADFLKFFFKEDLSGQEIIFSILSIFLAFLFIPVAQDLVLADIESGLIWCILGLVLSKVLFFIGSSHSKDSFIQLSGYRALSVFSAYFVPLLLCLLSIIMVTGSANLTEVVGLQGGYPWKWNVFANPGITLISGLFFISLLLWKGDAPFDYVTADSEILGGLESNYSSLKKLLYNFYSSASTFVSCALMVSLFFGGWKTPFDLESFGRASRTVEFIFFNLKIFTLFFLTAWIRNSMPRMSLDQIIVVSWKVIVPSILFALLFSLIWIGLYG